MARYIYQHYHVYAVTLLSRVNIELVIHVSNIVNITLRERYT